MRRLGAERIALGQRPGGKWILVPAVYVAASDAERPSPFGIDRPAPAVVPADQVVGRSSPVPPPSRSEWLPSRLKYLSNVA